MPTLHCFVARAEFIVLIVSHENLPKPRVLMLSIDFSKNDPISQILSLDPHRVDRSCDCAGFESVNAEGKNVGNPVYTQAINITRVGGGIGLVGRFLQISW